MDRGQELGHPSQPGLDVRRLQDQPARHPRHQHGRNVAIGPVRVDRDQPRRWNGRPLQQLQVSRFLLRQIRFFHQPGQADVASENQPQDPPARRAHIHGMHRRCGATPELPCPEDMGAPADAGFDPGPGARRQSPEMGARPAHAMSSSARTAA